MKSSQNRVLSYLILYYVTNGWTGFPKDVTFAEISCIGQKVGLDTLRTKIKEKIDR